MFGEAAPDQHRQSKAKGMFGTNLLGKGKKVGGKYFLTRRKIFRKLVGKFYQHKLYNTTKKIIGLEFRMYHLLFYTSKCSLIHHYYK